MPAERERGSCREVRGESKAYQAFGVLKQTDAEGRIRLLGATIVERGEDGMVWAKESVAAVGTATEATRRDQALLGLIEGEVRGVS